MSLRLPVSARTRIFAPVFALACLAGLVLVFARPPVYVSIARLQLESSKTQGKKGEESEKSPNLANAVQALTASAVLDQVRPHLPPGPSGDAQLRSMLSATPIAGSNVIELRAEGANGDILPQLLAVWIESYRRNQSESFERSSAAALDDARETLARLKEEIQTKRSALEQFRRKHDIVSLEREENQTTARLKGLNTALNDARNRQVNAEAAVNSMRANLAAGKPVTEGADRLIVELEKRAADVRASMKDLEQQFTASYLAIDSRYQAMKTTLARLEQQIEQEKRSSIGRALQKEEQEAESARRTVARLQEELAGRKREAQDFNSRLAESAALAAELKGLEEAQVAARDRLGQLQDEARRRPVLTVLSLPTVPDGPDRPDYWRDAALAVGGAAALGFLAVWGVEFFRRSGVPRPEPMTQPIINISLAPGMALDQGVRVIGATQQPALLESAAARLTAPRAAFPRELTTAEVRALWAAATPAARVVIAGLMGGLSLAELAGLRYRQVDFTADVARVAKRSCKLREPLRGLLAGRQREGKGESPLADAQGAPLTEADIEGLIACAVHDAGLAEPDEITAEALRHTYFAYLIRQGVRLADIGEFVGYVAPAAFRDYARLSPPGPGLPLEDIDPVFPALRLR